MVLLFTSRTIYHLTEQQQIMHQKLSKVCEYLIHPLSYDEHRANIAYGYIVSLTRCFGVLKADDIRLVYDALKSKLNDAWWALNFMLPDIDSVLNNCTLTPWLATLIWARCFSIMFWIPNYDLIRAWMSQILPICSRRFHLKITNVCWCVGNIF